MVREYRLNKENYAGTAVTRSNALRGKHHRLTGRRIFQRNDSTDYD